MEYAELGAFDPNQVKSATDNNGAFSASNNIKFATRHAQPLTSTVMTPGGPVPMGRIKAGDAVSTPSGVTTVLYTQDHGVQPVYRLKLDNGRTADSTADHLWLARIDGREQVLPLRTIMSALVAGKDVRIPYAA